MNRSGKWVRPNPETYIVQMEHLTSEEVYLTPGGEQKPVLNDNTLDIRRGESWGIVGVEAFEVELLLQIIGCVRPYRGGRCKLVERGMMRRKRRILPHVFFVGGSGMAVPNMNVLEYLMFATQYSGRPARDRQIDLLEIMLESGCYGWCFAPVKLLSGQERAVLSLLAATFSDALLFIFPYFYEDTSPELRALLALIARRLQDRRAALLLGTCDPSLSQDVCSHCAFLINGTLREHGTKDDITQSLDRRDYRLASSQPEKLCEALAALLPEYEARPQEKGVDLYHKQGAEPISQRDLLSVLAQIDLPILDIIRSERTIQNAFSEARNDLSDELL